VFKEGVAVAVVFCRGAEMQSGWRDGILESLIEAKLSQGKLSREGDRDTSGMF
jgi:hypothetical protein